MTLLRRVSAGDAQPGMAPASFLSLKLEDIARKLTTWLPVKPAVALQGRT